MENIGEDEGMENIGEKEEAAEDEQERTEQEAAAANPRGGKWERRVRDRDKEEVEVDGKEEQGEEKAEGDEVNNTGTEKP